MVQPLVSAVIAVYNLAPYVAEAIDSVLAQRDAGVDLEIIVVDDGSTDDLDAALRPYLGKIKLLRRRNGGVATALNTGMREARGRYLAICDADDVQLSHRFAAHAALLDQEPEVAQVFSDMQTWQDGEITAPSTLRDRLMGPFETSFDHALEQAFGSAHSTARARNLPVLEEHAERRVYVGKVPHLISVRHVAWTAFSMLRREAVLALGGYDENMKRWQDWYLSSLISQAYPQAYLDVPVALYRQHPNQLTKRPKLGAQMQKHVTDTVWRTDLHFRSQHRGLYDELVHHASLRLAAAHVRDREWHAARGFLLEAALAKPARREAWTALVRTTTMTALGRLRRRGLRHHREPPA